MRNEYSYPCLITYDKDDDVWYAVFPDIKSCFTDGNSLREVLQNAEDVLGLMLYEMEHDGNTIPQPEDIFIETEKNQSVYNISVWMPMVKDNIENRSVKKTLTLPSWLNDLGEKNNLNFSRILQAALKNQLGIR